LTELADRSASDLLADLRSGTLAAATLASACLDRIAAREPEVEAWAYLDRERVLAEASDRDAQHANGAALGALHGLPVGVKDIIDTADMPTENGTVIHKGRRPTADAVLVARLRRTGAVVMGKTVTSELAVYKAGPTRNPHDPSRSPGGSSSGSAAAVAAGMVPLALATQTNGSTIRPAAFCGIVGYKPSLGLLPRTGILHQSSILDQPGLMARTVADVALLADALMGADPADEMTFDPSWSLVEAAATPLRTPRLAFVRSPYWAQADATTRAALEQLATTLGLETVDLPDAFADAAEVQKTLMTAGIAEAFGPDYDRAGEQLSPVVAGIVEAGRKLSALDFVSAMSQRDRLREIFARRYAGYDAIVTPAALGIAPKRDGSTGNPIMATTWTLLGAPALTLPLLRGEDDMPLGVQLVGNLRDDARLLGAAAWLEARGVH